MSEWPDRAIINKEDTLQFFKSIQHNKQVDQMIQSIHEEVFNETDCIACANCCKTTPPLLTRKDIKRIALYLKITPKRFIHKYVIEDLNGDLVMNSVPCPFLDTDQSCSIYDNRPQACRRYPHTDEAGYHKRVLLNTENTIVCPAAYQIYKNLRKRIEQHDL